MNNTKSYIYFKPSPTQICCFVFFYHNTLHHFTLCMNSDVPFNLSPSNHPQTTTFSSLSSLSSLDLRALEFHFLILNLHSLTHFLKNYQGIVIYIEPQYRIVCPHTKNHIQRVVSRSLDSSLNKFVKDL
jgi:hypothetical protein